MTPTHKEATAESDEVKISFGSGFIKKIFPWLLGTVVLGGGTTVKLQHDAEIQELQRGQARIEGKLDLITEALDIVPAHPRRR